MVFTGYSSHEEKEGGNNLMTTITKETRRESFDEVLATLGERQKLILEYLNNLSEGITARELSTEMFNNGDIYSSERNSVHPRLNELAAKRLIEVTGKKICQFTNRKVALYKIKR